MNLPTHLIDSREEFADALALGDQTARFDGPAGWAIVCGAFAKVDAIRGFSEACRLRYSELARRGLAALRDRVEADMRSRDIVAAFAAHREDLLRSWPLVAWCLDGEHAAEPPSDLSLARTLLCMGFDADARDGDGRSALEIALDAKAGRRCQPRAVRVLLEAGADPDALDSHGDAPLMALARGEHWTEERDACARILLEHGADAHGIDGSESLLGILRAAEDLRPSVLRARLIAELSFAATMAPSHLSTGGA